ncbi:DUF362 domain-containing protein [Desulfonatronovibrio magnus]|uniref:DUF362 domain-containing protein n=1 Tax=Desulfonatronovibrio magnus TaxID=698827 RepID=UPI0005EB4BEC|nr:DUF362 domain-containing protein [Desulfonatronovibrio magnus]
MENQSKSSLWSKGKSLVSRRDFIKKQGKAALFAAAVAKAGFIFPSSIKAQDRPEIAVARGGPDVAARAAVDILGGMAHYVKPGDKVVIKPNMSFAHPPERATNTHPDVVKALAMMCVEAGAASVMILDNPLQGAELCLERSGIQEACSSVPQTSVHTFTSNRFFTTVDLDQGQTMKQTDVMNPVLDADVLIAAPVAKSHSGTGVSLSMKGMMGLIRDRGIMHRRFNLSSAIVDLCTFLKADLTIIDATRVLASHGPFGPGEVIQGNRVVASTDMVSADAMVVNMFPWYGRDIMPENVAHILEAHNRGLGRMDIENLTVTTVDA